MPRKRDPKRDKAFDIWLKSNKEMKLKDIAKKLKVSDGQIRKWKSEDKWEDKSVTNNEIKSNVTKQEKVTKSKVENNEKFTIDEDAGLTEKQRLFCLYYVKSFNATSAAIKAGYTQNYPSEIGYQLLQNPRVRREIERLKELKKLSIMINEDDILDRYMRIAFSDITDFVEFGQKDVPVFTSDGVLTNANGEIVTYKENAVLLRDSENVDGGLIAEVKTSRQGASIKLEDRLKALDWLAKFFEMNKEHQHKKEFDDNKLQLERDRFEHVKKMDEIKEW